MCEIPLFFQSSRPQLLKYSSYLASETAKYRKINSALFDFCVNETNKSPMVYSPNSYNSLQRKGAVRNQSVKFYVCKDHLHYATSIIFIFERTHDHYEIFNV